MKKYINKYPYIFCILITIVHICITFATDKSVFTFPDRNSGQYQLALCDYIICKILTFVCLYVFYRILYILIFDKTKTGIEGRAILKCALPYIAIVIVVLAIKLPSGYISNDENAIYANAVSLTHDTWFYYITTYYYIVSLMLLPFKYGPIILKVMLQIFTVGYVVYRIRKYYGSKLGMWGYVLFLLYPVIAYTTSAHRLPIYFLIYLCVFTKLLFDKLECHAIGRLELFVLLVLGALLTQWRTEGIYLAVLIPVLCLFAYTNLRDRRNILLLIICSLAIQYIVSIPQNGLSARGLDDAANDRMKPFYAYTITNMFRNGLDINKNAEDLIIIDKYMSLEKIVAINEHYEDINYEDVLILYQDGFVGVREEATVQDFIDYSDAVKRIFINNPDVFVKTRIGAFCYAALPYHIQTGSGIKGIISFAISVVKSVLYNLFVPICICFVLLLYSLIKKRWYSFFVFGGLMAHWFIVFILAPASYFKYYFPIYIMAYFYILVITLWIYKHRKDKDISSPLC